MEAYKTVWDTARQELTQKRSRFIATVKRVESRSEATDFINAVKAEFPDARHHVYAYTLCQQSYSKYSDDGEPSGTGGMPVLNVIKGRGLLDTAVVVTRYFGGVLLGTGGLSRAYSGAAAMALDAAGQAQKVPVTVYKATLDYRDFETASSADLEGTQVVAENYGQKVDVAIRVQAACQTAFQKKWNELFLGAPAPQKAGEEQIICKILKK